jgi:hypothetical protein
MDHKQFDDPARSPCSDDLDHLSSAIFTPQKAYGGPSLKWVHQLITNNFSLVIDRVI